MSKIDNREMPKLIYQGHGVSPMVGPTGLIWAMRERQELIEKWAVKMALGNNGGEWATHYTEDQKNLW
jgi:hypothetical protein